MSEYRPAGSTASDRAARLDKRRTKHLRIAREFGRFAAAVDSTSVLTTSVSMPTRDDGRVNVAAHLSHSSGPAEGAGAGELLITVKSTGAPLDESQLVDELNAQLQRFINSELTATLENEPSSESGAVPPTAITLPVDGTAISGWFVIRGHFQGIVLPIPEGAIAWLGENTSLLPTGIFTADLGDHIHS